MSYLQAVENKLMTVRVLKCTNALRHFLSAVGNCWNSKHTLTIYAKSHIRWHSQTRCKPSQWQLDVRL